MYMVDVRYTLDAAGFKITKNADLNRDVELQAHPYLEGRCPARCCCSWVQRVCQRVQFVAVQSAAQQNARVRGVHIVCANW